MVFIEHRMHDKLSQKLWLWLRGEAWQRMLKSNLDLTCVICCSLAFVLYINTLHAGFVYDDRRAILTNADVSGNAPLLRSFINDFWGTPLTDNGSHGSWRPLCVLSFRLNYILGGGYSPWGFHLFNILLHCVATALVVRVARTLIASAWGVSTAGALFAAHPIHTEAVAGVVGRADVAACVCFLLTYLSYLRHIRWRESGDRRQWLAFAATLFFSVAALLFKETSITALLVCALFDMIRGLSGQVDKQRTRSVCLLLAALFCTAYCRLVILPRPKTEFSTADNPIARTPSIWTRLLTFLYLPVFNFKLLLHPQMLSFDWGMDALPRVTSIWDRRNALTACFYSVLLLLAFRTCKFLYSHGDLRDAVDVGSYTHYHIQKLNGISRKSRSKRKRLAVVSSIKKYQAYEAAYQTVLPYSKHQHQGQHPCNDCNNNSSSPHLLSAGLIYGETPQNNHHQQLVSSGPSSTLSLVFHKAFRGSRSSSSCSNSTTTSNKSSGSSCSAISTCSSINGANCKLQSPSSTYMLEQLTPTARQAFILLMSCAFIILPFLPASNLFFYVGFVVAERLLYLPSVGFCLLVGYGVAKLMACIQAGGSRRQRGAMLLCLSVVLGALSVRTVRRNTDWRDEESLYRSAVAVNPPKALGNLGSVLSSQARYDEAKEALQEAIRYRPNMADVHFNLGILHQNQKDYMAAVECFQRAIKFRPNLAVAYLNLGISFIALGEQEQASLAFKLGATVDGASVRDRSAHEQARSSAYLQLGALYVEQGKLQRALAVYREALASLPPLQQQREVLYQRIGDVFGRLQQWDEAERHHRAALELQPNQVAAHLSYGITLARNSSRASEAEMWFKRALQLAPKQASVYHHYAEFLTMQLRHREAVIYHQRAAELAPADYALVVAAATSLRLLDRKSEAELWYRKAVTLRPTDAHAHTNLGAILHLLGRTHNAAASYKTALKFQPGDAIALGNLAKLGMTNV